MLYTYIVFLGKINQLNTHALGVDYERRALQFIQVIFPSILLPTNKMKWIYIEKSASIRKYTQYVIYKQGSLSNV